MNVEWGNDQLTSSCSVTDNHHGVANPGHLSCKKANTYLDHGVQITHVGQQCR